MHPLAAKAAARGAQREPACGGVRYADKLHERNERFGGASPGAVRLTLKRKNPATAGTGNNRILLRFFIKWGASCWPVPASCSSWPLPPSPRPMASVARRSTKSATAKLATAGRGRWTPRPGTEQERRVVPTAPAAPGAASSRTRCTITTAPGTRGMRPCAAADDGHRQDHGLPHSGNGESEHAPPLGPGA
jgi:hypothetical protein